MSDATETTQPLSFKVQNALQRFIKLRQKQSNKIERFASHRAKEIDEHER